MKKSILLITICCCCFSYSQNKLNYHSVAEYELIWQRDSTNINSKIKTENYTLYISDSISLFVSNNRINLDTLIHKANLSNIGKLRSLPKPTSNKRILKKTWTSSLLVYNEFYNIIYSYDDNVILKWKILSTIDTINGLKVKKANATFRGREYTAWFTNEIPISDGPYKFRGLPGLIIKIYDSKNQVSFSLIKFKPFKKSKSLIFNYDKEAIKTTRKKYNKSYEKFILNPLPLMESVGSVFNEETKRLIKANVKKRNKKRNNPIELKLK